MSTSRILAGVSAGVLLALSGGAQAADADHDFQRYRQRRGELHRSGQQPGVRRIRRRGHHDSTSTIGVNCTGTTPYSIDLDVGSGGGSFVNRTLANGTGGTLIYNLYTTAARTVVWGDDWARPTS